MPDPVSVFRKAHPDQKIVRLDISQADIDMVIDTLMDVASKAALGGMAGDAVALRHVAGRLRMAQ